MWSRSLTGNTSSLIALLLGRGLRCEGFQRFENTVRARVDADGRDIAPANHPFSIEDEQGAFGKAVLSAIGAISASDGAFGFKIGQQRKLQFAVAGKGQVTPDAVYGDAQ